MNKPLLAAALTLFVSALALVAAGSSLAAHPSIITAFMFLVAVLTAALGVEQIRALVPRAVEVIREVEVTREVEVIRKVEVIHGVARRPTEVYRFYDERGELLYVGVTFNFRARRAAHAAQQPWFPAVVREEVRSYESREVALAVEQAAIQHEGPLHNRAPGALRDPWCSPLAAEPAPSAVP